jgi:hypothetical protein
MAAADDAGEGAGEGWGEDAELIIDEGKSWSKSVLSLHSYNTKSPVFNKVMFIF